MRRQSRQRCDGVAAPRPTSRWWGRALGRHLDGMSLPTPRSAAVQRRPARHEAGWESHAHVHKSKYACSTPMGMARLPGFARLCHHAMAIPPPRHLARATARKRWRSQRQRSWCTIIGRIARCTEQQQADRREQVRESTTFDRERERRCQYRSVVIGRKALWMTRKPLDSRADRFDHPN